ncbi:unnamed protein product [Mytilus coruscus]|uniref:Uncharacterized protein n=1 Tax=Mytilus coruscus TaxID=42192 RepID=A0A6J8EJY0_MYTCO|nr:unnamed protein product [Mytilus coruscus]
MLNKPPVEFHRCCYRYKVKIDGKILKTNSVNDAYTEFGTITSAEVFTDTSSVRSSKTSSTKEIITDAVHINTKASTNLDTHISTTSKQIVTSTVEQTDDTPVFIGDNTNVLDYDLSTTKTEIVTPEKNSTLSAATTDSVTIILQKITPQTTISMDIANKAKTQTAQDNKTTQSIRQIGNTTDTDKKIDKQATTEIVYITNSETKQATPQLVSTVNDMSVTFVDTTAHAATVSDPKTSKAVQTTTQAATTKSTTEQSTTKASITTKFLSTTAEKSTTQTPFSTDLVMITTRDASKTDEQSNTTKQHQML